MTGAGSPGAMRDETGDGEERSMEPDGAEADAGAGDESIETRPIGTLFFLTVYIMVLAGMWLTMYWMLVTR